MTALLQSVPDCDKGLIEIYKLFSSGVSEPQTLAIVRHNILHPKTPAASLMAGRSDAQQQIYYIFSGATAVAVVTMLLVLGACALCYWRRWVDIV